MKIVLVCTKSVFMCMKSNQNILCSFNGSFESYTIFSGVADEEQKIGHWCFLRKSCSRNYEKIVQWGAPNFNFEFWVHRFCLAEDY